MLLVAGAAGPVVAQDVSINYERLSSLEEPIAREVGDVTFVLTGLVDTSYTHESEDGPTGTMVVGNAELSALTQLPNRWRLGMRYFGQYASDEETSPASRGRYADNLAMSVGGVWGTWLVGDVSTAPWPGVRHEAAPTRVASARGFSVRWWTRAETSTSGRRTSGPSEPGTTVSPSG